MEGSQQVNLVNIFEHKYLIRENNQGKALGYDCPMCVLETANTLAFALNEIRE
jgi:hypothetical protein